MSIVWVVEYLDGSRTLAAAPDEQSAHAVATRRRVGAGVLGIEILGISWL